MSQQILIKRSSVSGKVPTTEQLSLGELALNTHDGKVYLKKNVLGAESVVEVGAVSVSGDATGSGNGSITLTLSASGVTAGTYPKVTVDSKGRVTSGSSLIASDIPSLDWAKITSGTPTTLAGYGITDAAPAASAAIVNPVTAKEGDVKVAAGIISIYANGAWRQVFPAVYS
jgi:phage-related tail fiber protein